MLALIAAGIALVNQVEIGAVRNDPAVAVATYASGALLAVGEGRLTPARVQEILDAKERTALVKTAPPQGLFLDRVFYS